MNKMSGMIELENSDVMITDLSVILRQKLENVKTKEPKLSPTEIRRGCLSPPTCFDNPYQPGRQYSQCLLTSLFGVEIVNVQIKTVFFFLKFCAAAADLDEVN